MSKRRVDTATHKGKQTRATLPANGPKSITPGVSKVEKRRSKSRRVHKIVSPVLMKKFEAALDGTRNEILTWVEDSVQQIETDLTALLDQLTCRVKDQLILAGDLEACLYTAINQETVNIELSPLDPNGQRHRQKVLLVDRMEHARNLIQAEGRAVDILRQSWTRTQSELICLSVEVLGEKSIALPAAPLKRPPEPMFAAAVEKHNMLQQHYEQSTKNKTQLQTQVKDLKSKTLAKLNAQQKASRIFSKSEWRLNKRKHLNEIQKAIMNIQEYS